MQGKHVLSSPHICHQSRTLQGSVCQAEMEDVVLVYLQFLLLPSTKPDRTAKTGKLCADGFPHLGLVGTMTAMSRTHPKYNKVPRQEHVFLLSHQLRRLGLQQTRCPAFVH